MSRGHGRYGTRGGLLRRLALLPSLRAPSSAPTDAQANCPSCGSVYYAESAPAVTALVRDDERGVLLARRAHEPDAGLWDLLGGFLEEGEHPLDGLRRELREETGLDAEPGEFRGAYMDTYGDTPQAASVLNLVWEARLAAGEPSPADDVAELRWFALDELPPPEECAFRWVARFLDELAAATPVGATKVRRAELIGPSGRGRGRGKPRTCCKDLLSQDTPWTRRWHDAGSRQRARASARARPSAARRSRRLRARRP